MSATIEHDKIKKLLDLEVDIAERNIKSNGFSVYMLTTALLL